MTIILIKLINFCLKMLENLIALMNSYMKKSEAKHVIKEIIKNYNLHNQYG